MLRTVGSVLLGGLVTAALVYACHWAWGWVPGQLKGTSFASFGVIPKLLAVFAVLSVADFVIDRVLRLVAPGESPD